MTQTQSLSTLAQYMVDLIKQPANLATLSIPDAAMVFYGDQQMVPRTPAVAVEPGALTRSLSGKGASGRTDNVFTIYLMAYLAKISSNQAVRKQSDELAERLVNILHSDRTMGGLVIHGFVTSLESGFAVRGGTLMRTARLTWQGLTKTLIP